MRINAVPLTAEAYSRYGDVVMAAPRGEAGVVANQGTARKWPGLAPFRTTRPGASASFSVFRSEPRATFPFAVALLEKHPCSTQAFLPMNARRFLVVVARGEDAPNLSTLAAFVATGAQGITYHPGVWHHPMIALDSAIDFAVLVGEDGTASDCVEHPYAEGERALVLLDG